MMKKMMCLTIIFAIISLVGCSTTNTSYSYLNDVSEINFIEIVELSEFNDETYEFIQTVICEIDNIENFIGEFSKIKCTVHYTDPLQLDVGETVIKIVYNNGEYELISSAAQMQYDLNGSHYGWVELDDEQFEALILKYVVNTENVSLS